MTAVLVTYAAYLALSVALTVWVARTLSQNGAVFLIDVFHGNEALAASVNHLLVVGFYLVNLGFVCWTMRLGYDVAGPRVALEALADKMGTVLLTLGAMHFFNLWVFKSIRARATVPFFPPPVEPDACLPAAAR